MMSTSVRRRLPLATGLLLLIFILAACSIPGMGASPPGGNSPAASTNPAGSAGGSSKPVTEQLNLHFTYASVNYIVTSVQEAKSFSDDTNRYDPSQVVVRVNIQETSTTPYSATFSFYDQIAHLLLPDGSAVQLALDKFDRALTPQTSRVNWLDFPVTGPTLDLSKLTLQMGFPSEVQMDIPLTPNANLSQYQPKSVSLNTTLHFSGLTYTLTGATESLGADGHQVNKGQVFITVNMKVTNPTSTNFDGFASDYMRLKSADGTTNAPVDGSPDNFLSGVDAQSSQAGYQVFAMPQGGTLFALILTGGSGVQGTSTTFQIPPIGGK